MALINCEDCQSEISDSALVCPKCGRQNYDEPSAKPDEVTVVDIDIPFRSMAGLMVKWAFATIPALVAISRFPPFLRRRCRPQTRRPSQHCTMTTPRSHA
jgi:hypothetical protein